MVCDNSTIRSDCGTIINTEQMIYVRVDMRLWGIILTVNAGS